MSKKNVKSTDYYKLISISDPQLSSDGVDLMYVETYISEEKDDYFSHLHYINLNEKGKSRQWTYGEQRDHSPRWSPKGHVIAFISNRSGSSQLYICPRSGGEARQLTSFRNGVHKLAWSPDGQKIALQVSTFQEDDDGNNKTEESHVKLRPLEIDKMKYKSDEAGFWDGRHTRIALLDVETEEIEFLTDWGVDCYLQSWSPNGEYLAVSADLNKELDYSFVSDVYLLNLESKVMQNITMGRGYFGEASWSPDGNYVAMIGNEREYENATLNDIWVYSIHDNALSCLTAGSDIAIGDLMIGDFHQGISSPGIQWANDNHSFYFLASDNGNTVLYYGSLHGELYPALLEDQHVYGLSTGGNVNRAVVAISTPTLHGELYVLNIPTGELEALTSVNKVYQEEVQLAETEKFEMETSDGWRLQGWMMKPVNYVEGNKYPLILEIHGGPHAMYGHTYFHEFQMLAAEGFAVLYLNPRGSHGYGQQFVDAVRGDYGGRDYEDLMEAVDYAIRTYSFIDEDRLGVTGGSYGGFMTNWIVGHSNRFKAAVTQRSISNWISFYGVSDIGYYFNEWQIQSELEDVDTLWKHSPLAYVGNVETPLLILHSEKDYRCPIEQAEQLFIALKHRKKQTKFIRFPESNHELSRSGKPSLRIARLHYILSWFKEHIK